jgi:DNA-binding beta-propeller fold protein YncE
VADPPTLQCFEPTGMMVGYVGQVGTLIGQYTGMAGITSDAEHIYVLDAHNHCVTMHRATDMMPLKKIGSRGSGNGQFHHHNWGSDLVLDGQGRLYVSDCNNDRVSVFSTELDFKYQLRGFSKPGSVAYGNSQLFVRCGGEIYVLNVNSRKVVRKMVVQGRLEGVAFFRDHLLVTSASKVDIITPDGVVAGRVDLADKGVKFLTRMCVDPTQTLLYVLDRQSRKVHCLRHTT